MTDESKVKTTFIRPVNRTMSYEDRRGYVCMYVCMYTGTRFETCLISGLPRATGVGRFRPR